MKALVVYWSKTKNTEKVAHTIKEGLLESCVDIVFKRTEEAADEDFFDYDLVCACFPTYQWLPPKPANDFFMKKLAEYREQGRVKLGAPKVPGKNALICCTYSGPHTGVNEAIPAGKYVGQLFEHIGFTILDEWYILGEFHGSEARSTMGKLGDIKGRPNEEDLQKVREDVVRLVQAIQTPISHAFQKEAAALRRILREHIPQIQSGSKATPLDGYSESTSPRSNPGRKRKWSITNSAFWAGR
jgi:flavodoxin